jgi:hypothetical protein
VSRVRGFFKGRLRRKKKRQDGSNGDDEDDEDDAAIESELAKISFGASIRVRPFHQPFFISI